MTEKETKIYEDALREKRGKADIDKLIESLGEPCEENKYRIFTLDGEWGIDHFYVGSGEPLKQWLETHIKTKP